MEDILLNKHLQRFERKLIKKLESHQMMHLMDKDMIQTRSRWAARAYAGALSAGNSEKYCEEIALSILWDSLFEEERSAC